MDRKYNSIYAYSSVKEKKYGIPESHYYSSNTKLYHSVQSNPKLQLNRFNDKDVEKSLNGLFDHILKLHQEAIALKNLFPKYPKVMISPIASTSHAGQVQKFANMTQNSTVNNKQVFLFPTPENEKSVNEGKNFFYSHPHKDASSIMTRNNQNNNSKINSNDISRFKSNITDETKRAVAKKIEEALILLEEAFLSIVGKRFNFSKSLQIIDEIISVLKPEHFKCVHDHKIHAKVIQCNNVVFDLTRLLFEGKEFFEAHSPEKIVLSSLNLQQKLKKMKTAFFEEKEGSAKEKNPLLLEKSSDHDSKSILDHKTKIVDQVTAFESSTPNNSAIKIKESIEQNFKKNSNILIEDEFHFPPSKKKIEFPTIKVQNVEKNYSSKKESNLNDVINSKFQKIYKHTPNMDQSIDISHPSTSKNCHHDSIHSFCDGLSEVMYNGDSFQQDKNILVHDFYNAINFKLDLDLENAKHHDEKYEDNNSNQISKRGGNAAKPLNIIDIKKLWTGEYNCYEVKSKPNLIPLFKTIFPFVLDHERIIRNRIINIKISLFDQEPKKKFAKRFRRKKNVSSVQSFFIVNSQADILKCSETEHEEGNIKVVRQNLFNKEINEKVNEIRPEHIKAVDEPKNNQKADEVADENMLISNNNTRRFKEKSLAQKHKDNYKSSHNKDSQLFQPYLNGQKIMDQENKKTSERIMAGYEKSGDAEKINCVDQCNLVELQTKINIQVITEQEIILNPESPVEENNNDSSLNTQKLSNLQEDQYIMEAEKNEDDQKFLDSENDANIKRARHHQEKTNSLKKKIIQQDESHLKLDNININQDLISSLNSSEIQLQNQVQPNLGETGFIQKNSNDRVLVDRNTKNIGVENSLQNKKQENVITKPSDKIENKISSFVDEVNLDFESKKTNADEIDLEVKNFNNKSANISKFCYSNQESRDRNQAVMETNLTEIVELRTSTINQNKPNNDQNTDRGTNNSKIINTIDNNFHNEKLIVEISKDDEEGTRAKIEQPENIQFNDENIHLEKSNKLESKEKFQFINNSLDDKSKQTQENEELLKIGAEKIEMEYKDQIIQFEDKDDEKQIVLIENSKTELKLHDNMENNCKTVKWEQNIGEIGIENENKLAYKVLDTSNKSCNENNKSETENTKLMAVQMNKMQQDDEIINLQKPYKNFNGNSLDSIEKNNKLLAQHNQSSEVGIIQSKK